jgi:penicillin-binding protein 1C
LGERVASVVRLRAALRGLLGMAVLVPALGLTVTAIAVVIEPMPELLRLRRHGAGLVVLDSRGRTLGQMRGEDYRLAVPVKLVEVPEQLRNAVIAAEDARFYRHRGVDPLAIGRAVWQLARQRRIVSGASTITQQLARSVVERPRTLFGKWREVVVSLRIESEYDKAAILEAYLNHVPFGPTTRGIAAAANDYLGKPLQSISVAEGCTLAALPRGPARYHPRQHEARLLVRRNRIVERMRMRGFIDAETARQAALEPIAVREGLSTGKAPHFMRALAQGRFDQSDRPYSRASILQTTLDRELQTEVEKLVRDARDGLVTLGASAAAVVVVENENAGLLSYVGSIDFSDVASLGQNDGCLALRQPGSALKPFVYAAGIEWLGMGPTTQLFDVETEFDTPNGTFSPKNYDGRFHGLVLLREALGASLNVPAVAVAQRVGVERLLSLLRGFGFRSLREPAEHYGLALALGDGEVRLLELAAAYATLARHGMHRPLRIVTHWSEKSGERHEVPKEPGTRVLADSTAWQILEILADDAARIASFGRHGTLEMPLLAAVKTGTSSNHRDNWAVAATREVTAAVWVGNFDGRPLAHGVSGAVGAAPLLRAVLFAAMRGRPGAALFPAEQLLPRRICKNSGMRAGPDCSDTVQSRTSVGHGNDGYCTLHQRVKVDPDNGLLAGPGCRDAVERVVEAYPDNLMPWARAAGRPLGPTAESPRCPGAFGTNRAGLLVLHVPKPGAKYLLDPHLPRSQQNLAFTLKASAETNWVEYDVDGERSGRIHPPFHWSWALRPGQHRVRVVASNGAKAEADFNVD